MMLPTAQAIAAPITSAKPITVPVRPLASLYAASTIIPAAAIDRAHQVVPVEAVAGERDGETDREEHLQLDHERRQPRGHPELEPRNSRPNWQTPIAKP